MVPCTANARKVELESERLGDDVNATALQNSASSRATCQIIGTAAPGRKRGQTFRRRGRRFLRGQTFLREEKSFLPAKRPTPRD